MGEKEKKDYVICHDYNFQGTEQHLLDLRAVFKVNLNHAEQTHMI